MKELEGKRFALDGYVVPLESDDQGKVSELLSWWLFTPELANGRVQAVPPERAPPDIDLWAVFPSGRLATAEARAYADFVLACTHGEGAEPSVRAISTLPIQRKAQRGA